METKLQRLSPTTYDIDRVVHFHFGLTHILREQKQFGLNPYPIEPAYQAILFYAAMQRLLYAICTDRGEMLGYAAGYLPGILLPDDIEQEFHLINRPLIPERQLNYIAGKYRAIVDIGCDPYTMLVQSLVRPMVDQEEILDKLLNQLLREADTQRTISVAYFTNKNQQLCSYLETIGFKKKENIETKDYPIVIM